MVQKINVYSNIGSNRRYGKVGDVIIGVVKDATPNLTVKRSDVVRAVIVRTKHSHYVVKMVHRLRFDDNASVIINKENNPRGTRVFGPIARELKKKGLLKLFL